MNTDFLLHNNINSLYKSIKERIHSQINYNIDKKEEKYRNVINKLLIKISKKDGLGLEDLNSMALQMICPFLISKIQNTKIPNITFTPTRNIDRITPIRAAPIQKTTHAVDSFMDDSNTNLSSNIIGSNDNSNQYTNDNFLNSLEGFQNFDHSDGNNLESFKDNDNLNSNIIGDTTEHFLSPTTTLLPTTTLSPQERLYNEMVEYKEVNERKPYGDIIFNELKSKQLLINEINKLNTVDINYTYINSLIDTKIPKNNYIDDLKLELSNDDQRKNFIDTIKTSFTYDEYLTYDIIKNKLISIRNYIVTEAAKKQNGKQIDTDTELTIQFKSDDESAPEWVRNNGVFYSLDKHSRVLTIRKTKNTIMFNTSNPKPPSVLLKDFFKKLKKKISTIFVGFEHSKLVIGDTTIQLGNGNGESINVKVKYHIENLNKIVETIDQFINDKMKPILNKAKERETNDIINARSIEPSFTTASLYNQEDGGSDPYINRQNRLIDYQNKQIERLSDAFDKLKEEGINKKTVGKYLNLHQVSTNTIKHKTLLILDIVRHRNNPSSVEDIFKNWGLVAAPAPPGVSNITNFEIKLGDPLVYPPNTEVTLEYFTIHKFKGITNNVFMQHKRLEEFDSFIIKINGGKFSSFKHYSNTDTFSERASIIVPNDGFGFSDSNEGTGTLSLDGLTVDTAVADKAVALVASKTDQVTYTLRPKSNYIGTFSEGGIIDTLHIDLMGSYVDALPGSAVAVPDNGCNTWTYLYPYDQKSRCTIGLMLKPLPR